MCGGGVPSFVALLLGGRQIGLLLKFLDFKYARGHLLAGTLDVTVANLGAAAKRMRFKWVRVRVVL
jgi:hypothetical protein